MENWVKSLLPIIFFSCSMHLNCMEDLPQEGGYEHSRAANPSVEQLFAYIKTKYEHTVNGRTCIFYPAQNPQRLIIVFGYAIAGRYAMWTWFWRTDEKWTDTSYLFLKDDDLCWYLGNNTKPALDDYCSMINYFMQLCGVSKNKVYTTGGSMGGYGAILFATMLGFKGAIVDIPTVRRSIWAQLQPPNTTKIKSEERWIDLDTMLSGYKKVPLISLHHGKHPADAAAAHALMDVLIGRAPLIIYRTTSKSAHSVFTITKASVEADIAYMDSYQETESLERESQEWPYQIVERSSSTVAFGYGNTAYKALFESVRNNYKGAMLVHPCTQSPEYSQLERAIAQSDVLPFVAISYNNHTQSCAYDLLKLMRDKIGCFTLHYKPKEWRMNSRHFQDILTHFDHQKLLQLPHFV